MCTSAIHQLYIFHVQLGVLKPNERGRNAQELNKIKGSENYVLESRPQSEGVCIFYSNVRQNNGVFHQKAREVQ